MRQSSTSDQISPNTPFSYADLYRLTLASSTAVTIDMRSTAFTSEAYVLSSTGTVLYDDSFSGGNANARITATLPAGTYYVEASSFSESTSKYSAIQILPLSIPGTRFLRDGLLRSATGFRRHTIV